MTRLRVLSTPSAQEQYRATLTGEKLGWLAYRSDFSFASVHQIQMDPLHGPVIVAGREVVLVDEDATIFTTRAAAERS